jgi:hypothetical protein
VSLMLPICPWCAGFTVTVRRLYAVCLANEEKVLSTELLYYHSSIAPPQLSFGRPTTKQASLTASFSSAPRQPRKMQLLTSHCFTIA